MAGWEMPSTWAHGSLLADPTSSLPKRYLQCLSSGRDGKLQPTTRTEMDDLRQKRPWGKAVIASGAVTEGSHGQTHDSVSSRFALHGVVCFGSRANAGADASRAERRGCQC